MSLLRATAERFLLMPRCLEVTCLASVESAKHGNAIPVCWLWHHTATNHPQIGIREFDHPCRMCRQFCLLRLAQVLAVACVLPSSNNVLGFHDISPFRFRL